MLKSPAMFELIRRVGLLYSIEYAIVRAHFKIWHNLKVVGADKVPPEGGVIIASNHLSHLDSPPVGGGISRKVSFVADEKMFKTFFLKYYLPHLGGVSVTRTGGKGGEMIDAAADAIKSGKLLIIYPEGTRSRDGAPGRCRTGIMVIAAKSGSPIVPCRVSGTYECWPYSKIWPRPGPIMVSFGDPIRFEPGEIDIDDRDKMKEQSENVMDVIMDLPGWWPRTADITEEEWRRNREAEKQKRKYT